MGPRPGGGGLFVGHGLTAGGWPEPLPHTGPGSLSCAWHTFTNRGNKNRFSRLQPKQMKSSLDAADLL